METSRVQQTLLSACGWLPARISLAALTFFASVNVFTLRVNLSVAIVAMVRRNHTFVSAAHTQCLAPPSGNMTEGEDARSGMMDTSSTTTPAPTQLEDEGEMDWDEVTQGVILASYYYGYVFTQVLGGRLAEKYGPKKVLGFCITSSGICTLFTPLAARAGSSSLIALRVILGLCSGMSWPTFQCILARWIPPLERPRFVAFVHLASTLSVTFSLPLCGYVIATHGWAATFYMTGSLAIIWGCFWFPLMHDTPTQHPRITAEELEYIEKAVTSAGITRSKLKRVPWREMATSLPAWAIIVAGMGNSFGLALYMTQLPTYMKNVLGFSIKENGALSGLPFLCRYVGGVISSTSGDWLLGHGYLSIVNTRRIYSAIAMLGPAMVLVVVAYSGCNATAAVALLCFSLFLNGSITTGQLVNHTDIAPNFSGTLFGICNTFANISSFIAPMAVGALTRGQQTVGQWRKVFWMCVPIYGFTELFYLVFCSGTVQPWNYADHQLPQDDTKDDQETEATHQLAST